MTVTGQPSFSTAQDWNQRVGSDRGLATKTGITRGAAINLGGYGG